MRNLTKKSLIFILAIITVLSAFCSAILFIPPQTARASHSTWDKTQLNVGDKIYGKYVMMHIEPELYTADGLLFSTTTQGTADVDCWSFATGNVFAGFNPADWRDMSGVVLSEYIFYMQATEDIWNWGPIETDDYETVLIYYMDAKSSTIEDLADFCTCENGPHDSKTLWVDETDQITYIADGITLYELTEPVINDDNLSGGNDNIEQPDDVIPEQPNQSGNDNNNSNGNNNYKFNVTSIAIGLVLVISAVCIFVKSKKK